MKEILVGYRDFIGSNLADEYNFSELYDSENIEEAYDTNPDLLVYSDVPSSKTLADKFPQKDFEAVEKVMNSIKKINPKKTILISTIDVYDNPSGVYEISKIDTDKLSAYGKNRYMLEKFVEENYKNHLIVRLPEPFGKNLKKNFIYDYLNPVPPLIPIKIFENLLNKNDFIKDYYTLQNNEFYKCNELKPLDRKLVDNYFKNVNFSSINFTDSRSVFQFYDLSKLWQHINIALNNGIKKINLATEPISISELYKALSCKDFHNELEQVPYNYNFKTLYTTLYGGNNGYIYSKKEVVLQIWECIKKMEE